MEKLKLETKNLAKEKFNKLIELFPNALTETITGQDEEGRDIIERAIDADILRQEISENVLEGREERYEFTWPDKRRSILLANAPINKTLRPVREESLNFDTTENLYIEGDNLEVLKLLRETYLGKIKMVYIDPPYNTGNDFVYGDDFAQTMEEYKEISGDYDDEGNRLFKNTDSNGRFHTDWLNMMYPRLKLARDFLSDDGVIFISIDDNEVHNLRKSCDDIFGEENFINCITIKMSELSGVKMANVNRYPKLKESLLIYSKNKDMLELKIEKVIKSEDNLIKYLNYYSNIITNINEEVKDWKIESLQSYFSDNNISFSSDKELNSWKISNAKRLIYRTNSRTVEKYIVQNPNSPSICKFKNNRGKEIIKWDNKEMLFLNNYLEEYLGDIWMDISTINLNKENCGLNFFQNGQKPLKLIKRIIKSCDNPNNPVILDFFSGSATTAHAVMELNAEDGGNRKYIMVQLPEETDEKSEAYKAGYKNICEIGKERIRRAGKKIKEENPDSEFDDGFRVLKVDSSNMKDIFHSPEKYNQSFLDKLESNIKEDRSEEDLLFQVMLDLGIDLSSQIKVEKINGNKVLIVEDGFLISCFDRKISEKTIENIAKKEPYYAVFTEGKMSDSALANFEQIFETYSPSTIRKVI